MKLILYQVDAFTSKLFGGNPAAVIPLKKWLSTELMQKLALENNLSETVFFVPSEKKGVDYDIRWFTPAVEINLCGHATLASGYIIFREIKKKKKSITFSCKSGLLKVSRKKDQIEMDFPSWKPSVVNEPPANLSEALGGVEITGVYKQRDLLVELKNESAVQKCNPDFGMLKKMGEKLIITAPGKDCDFVSRFFAPTAGINEDPVTGSAHTTLTPLWAEKLGKSKLSAIQISPRRGYLECELKGERVEISGGCVIYMTGEVIL